MIKYTKCTYEEEMKMKKMIVGILIATCIPVLAACSFNPSSESGKMTNESTESNQTLKIPKEMVEVRFKTKSGSYEADDGTEVLKYKIIYPEVTIDGKEEIAKKINNDIESYKTAYDTAISQMLETAKSDYEFMKSEDDMEYHAYSMECRFNLQRNDENVLSFTLLDSNYTGGAHGNYGSTGINYSVVSGDKITMNNLSNDTQAFQEKASEYLYALSKTSGYKERLFEGYDKQLLTDSLFMEGKWYFGNEGIIFFADPYMLGPYAAGTIEFAIPYEELPDLKEEYAYHGNYEQMAAQGNSVQKDINGDGKEDTILFAVNYSEEDYSAMVTFQINGQDIKSDAVLEFPAEEYYLVDLDQKDPYIEVAIQDYGPSDDPMTYFFRYLEDGSTVLLGSITDLWSSDTSKLLENNLLEGRARLAVLQTWYAPAHWKLEGNKITKIEEPMYYPYESSITENHILKDITVYDKMSQEGEKSVLTAKEGLVHFIATDDKNWVELETADNSHYFMYLKDYSMVDSNGTEIEAASVFDSLIIAD